MNGSHIGRLAALAVVVAACAQKVETAPRPDAVAIRTALTAELTRFGHAILVKDAAGVANMFTEDGVWILPDAGTYTGRTAIKARASDQFQTFESFVIDQLTIDRLVVISDTEALTFSHGHYTLTETGRAPVHRVNPVADLWKKGTDGTWRVSYELNADGPAPTEVGTRP